MPTAPGILSDGVGFGFDLTFQGIGNRLKSYSYYKAHGTVATRLYRSFLSTCEALNFELYAGTLPYSLFELCTVNRLESRNPWPPTVGRVMWVMWRRQILPDSS